MAYFDDYSDYMSERFDYSIEEILENKIKYLKREIVPNIKNSALLLKEAQEIIFNKVDDIVEKTIEDEMPNTRQMHYVFTELNKILSNKNEASKLNNSKYIAYFEAWSTDYKMKLQNWLREYSKYYL